MRPRERQTSSNYSLHSISHDAQQYTDSINSLWFGSVLKLRLIHTGMCIVLDPYGNKRKNKETSSTPSPTGKMEIGFEWILLAEFEWESSLKNQYAD